MATTKKTIAYEIVKLISGGDQSRDSTIDIRELMLKITHVLNYKVKLSFFENYKFGEPGIDGQYISTFKNVAVTLDPDRSEYYCLVPNIYVALPKNRGIRSITPMKDQCPSPVLFIIRDSGARSIYSALPASGLEGNIGVYPEGGRFYFDKEINKKGITKLLIKLAVAAPDSLGEDDPLPLDAGEINNIIMEVVAMYANPVVQDKIDNNNPNM